MILALLRLYNKTPLPNYSLLERDDLTEWYNNLSMMVYEYLPSRLCRAIAKNPTGHIIYVTYSDTISKRYIKARLSLMLLLTLAVLTEKEYHSTLEQLNKAISVYGFVNEQEKAVYFNDGSVCHFDGIY